MEARVLGMTTDNAARVRKTEKEKSLEGSDGFVSSTIALRATGWSDPGAGQEFHLLKINAWHESRRRPSLTPRSRLADRKRKTKPDNAKPPPARSTSDGNAA
jgi:hypothetical protein